MNGTVPKGLCVHCLSPVEPGPEGLMRPGGQVSHRTCRKANLDFERAEATTDKRVFLAVFVFLVGATALMVFALQS